jgi:hypothetical protein
VVVVRLPILLRFVAMAFFFAAAHTWQSLSRTAAVGGHVPLRPQATHDEPVIFPCRGCEERSSLDLDLDLLCHYSSSFLAASQSVHCVVRP